MKKNAELFQLLSSHGWHFERADRIQTGSKSSYRAYFRKNGVTKLLKDALWEVYKDLGMPEMAFTENVFAEKDDDLTEDQKEQLRLDGLY